MGNSKYFFNQETLSYEKADKRLSKKMLRFSAYTFVVLIVAAGISAFFLNNYETPQMKTLQNENNNLLSQFEFLNEKLEQIEEVLDEIQIRDDNLYRVIFETDPIPASIRKAGFGGVDAYSALESFSNSELVMQTTKKIDIVSRQAFIQGRSYEEVLNLAREKELELASIPAIMPISNQDLSHTSSGWGMRTHPIFNTRMFHYGIDFVASTGTPIYATGSGTVTSVRTLRTGHGKHVVIDHGFGYETLYGHMSAFNVKVGDKVTRGQIIGYVGSSGTSTAPHLHYEVHKDGRIVNPVHYFFRDLSPHEFEQLVAISSNIKRSFD